MGKIIEFKSVKLGYGKKIVFDSLNFNIYRGDFWGIVGPNGSGKTTILRSIMGLLKAREGIILRDKTLRFGYCMQRQFIDILFPFTVFEIVMMARTAIIGPLKKPDDLDRVKTLKALETTGISHLAAVSFRELSGGQKQRVLIARALNLEPDFLILDEPTADLDVKAEKEILKLIENLYRDQTLTVALVTHELNEVINCARKFLFLDKKRPYKTLKREELTGELLSEIFGTKIELKKIDGKQIVI